MKAYALSLASAILIVATSGFSAAQADCRADVAALRGTMATTTPDTSATAGTTTSATTPGGSGASSTTADTTTTAATTTTTADTGAVATTSTGPSGTSADLKAQNNQPSMADGMSMEAMLASAEAAAEAGNEAECMSIVERARAM